MENHFKPATIYITTPGIRRKAYTKAIPQKNRTRKTDKLKQNLYPVKSAYDPTENMFLLLTLVLLGI